MVNTKEFNYHLKVIVDEDHPLYNKPNNVINGEIAILVMNGMSEDPTIYYECEVI